jgi:hypothetical protein
MAAIGGGTYFGIDQEDLYSPLLCNREAAENAIERKINSSPRLLAIKDPSLGRRSSMSPGHD